VGSHVNEVLWRAGGLLRPASDADIAVSRLLGALGPPAAAARAAAAAATLHSAFGCDVVRFLSSMLQVQGGLKLAGFQGIVESHELRRQTAKQQMLLAVDELLQDPEKQLPQLKVLLEFVQDEDPRVRRRLPV